MTRPTLEADGLRALFRAERLFVLARHLTRMALVALVAWGSILSSARAADDTGALEQRVKAAFLYQFAGYVEWPEGSFTQADTPVTIAVVGSDSFATELSQVVTGRTVAGRTVAVRRMKSGESLAGVHILFVGRKDTAQLDQLGLAARPRAILTVTEADDALAHGSMINFVLDERRVRFEVALDTVEKGGLRLSSRLLAVARDVRIGGGR